MPLDSSTIEKHILNSLVFPPYIQKQAGEITIFANVLAATQTTRSRNEIPPIVTHTVVVDIYATISGKCSQVPLPLFATLAATWKYQDIVISRYISNPDQEQMEIYQIIEDANLAIFKMYTNLNNQFEFANMKVFKI